MERLFNTFQDRVIKEMRLADVSRLEAANQFLKGYLPIYNRRFAVRPAQAADLHRPCPAHRELDRILCLKTTRCLRKDFTIAYQGGLYQDSRDGPGSPRPGGRACEWDHADHVPGAGARHSRDPISACEGHGKYTCSSAPALAHAEAGSSLAPTPAARAEKTVAGGENLTRTFLLWLDTR